MKLGLRYKLTTVVVGALLLMGLALVSVQQRHERNVLQAALHKRAVSLAKGLAYNAEFGVLTSDYQECKTLVSGVIAQDDAAYASLRAADGDLLALAKNKGAPAPRYPALTDSDGTPVIDEFNVGNDAFIQVSLPIFSLRRTDAGAEELTFQPRTDSDFERVRIGECHIGMSMASVRTELRTITWTLILLVGAVILVGGAAIVIAVNRLIIRPVIKLLDGTRTVAGGDLDLVVSAGGGRADEMTLLAENFNAMIHSLRVSRNELSNQLIEIDRLSRLKSEFLASVSHELRTPLNSINGYSQLLLTGIEGTLTDDQRKSISKILKNGNNLLDLINDILDLSKIESGRMSVTPEPFELPDCIDSILATMEPLRAERRLTVSADLDPNLAPMETDRSKVKQILTNLLSNAFKFTPEGEVRITARQESDKVVIEVMDSGIGIPQERLADIFEEFIQVKTAQGSGQQGTGLGLAITRKLVRLLGGEITVRSELGSGSVFTVILPRRIPASASSLTELE